MDGSLIADSSTNQPAERSTDAAPTSQDEQLVCSGCGRVHADSRLVDLPDGRVVGNYSEDYRRYCEAVWVLKKKRSKRTRIEYLDAVEAKRGLEARLELRAEMMKLWEMKEK